MLLKQTICGSIQQLLLDVDRRENCTRRTGHIGNLKHRGEFRQKICPKIIVPKMGAL